MKIRKTPLRKCIICNEQFDKKSLIRIVRNSDSHVFIDKTFKANGRGAYVCNNSECIDKILKIKALDRAFKEKIDEEVYYEIISEIKDVE